MAEITYGMNQSLMMSNVLSVNYNIVGDEIAVAFQDMIQTAVVLKELNKPLLLAGDFNNPAGQEGYQAILASPLGLQDAFEVSQEKSGSYTVPPEIDGWKGNTEPLRIDYVFTTKELAVENLHVVFDGTKSPQVSDHYGLNAILNWK